MRGLQFTQSVVVQRQQKGLQRERYGECKFVVALSFENNFSNPRERWGGDLRGWARRKDKVTRCYLTRSLIRISFIHFSFRFISSLTPECLSLST